MPLTAQKAAEIARRNGLSLNDAAGLLSLADNEDDAERIAADFATGEGAWWSTVRKLFDTANDDDGGVFGRHGRITGDLR